MTTRKILLIITIFSLSLFSKAQTESEYQIIEKVIIDEITPRPNDTVFKKDGRIKKVIIHEIPDIVLQVETEKPLTASIEDTSLYNIFRINRELSSLDREAFNDFYIKNDVPIKISLIKGFNAKIIYKSKEDIMNIFERGDWRLYYRKFGYKPYVRISRPGLNTDKNKAFIYYRISRGGLSGYGIFLTLEKKDGNWLIKETMLGDIS